MFLKELARVFSGIAGKAKGIVAEITKAGMRGFIDLLNMEKIRITCTIQVKLDERTCKICRPKQGKKVTLPGNYTLERAKREGNNISALISVGGSALWGELPKFHPNCRCNVDISLS